MDSIYNTDLSRFIGADLDWDTVLQVTAIIEQILHASGISPPEWLIRTASKSQAETKFLEKTQAIKVSGPPKPRLRAPDSKAWIKDNRYTGGIRERKIEARPPTGMPRPASLEQYRRHAIHLMSRVLNIRTNGSPFTLVLDDLNQNHQPFTTEMIRRGISRNVNVVVVSFEAVPAHPFVHHINGYGDQTGTEILAEIEKAMKDAKESLVIIDSLQDLLNVKRVNMNTLFGLVVMKYASTLVGIYHQDMLPEQNPDNSYEPQSLDVLKFMATSIITCKSFAHALAAKAARERSLPEPTHGLLQGAEGIVQCLDANDHRGIVLEAEFRRKSGRPESETYFLRPALVGDYNEPLPGRIIGTLKQEFTILLEQVPAYSNKEVTGLVQAAANEIESTFNLGLTDKQKVARDGVILPYFDAQSGEGGEGGRILYDMGAEDDFDEEEDEI